MLWDLDWMKNHHSAKYDLILASVLVFYFILTNNDNSTPTNRVEWSNKEWTSGLANIILYVERTVPNYYCIVSSSSSIISSPSLILHLSLKQTQGPILSSVLLWCLIFLLNEKVVVVRGGIVMDYCDSWFLCFFGSSNHRCSFTIVLCTPHKIKQSSASSSASAQTWNHFVLILWREINKLKANINCNGAVTTNCYVIYLFAHK